MLITFSSQFKSARANSITNDEERDEMDALGVVLAVLVGLFGTLFLLGIGSVFFFVIRGFLGMGKRRKELNRTWDRYKK